MDYLREHQMVYYTIYRVMLESGTRFEYILRIIELRNPSEAVETSRTSVVTRRLVSFDDKGFCHYYMGLRGAKPCEWVYFSAEFLTLLLELVFKHINRHQVKKYARRHGLVLPKCMRKVSWRLMIKTTSREVHAVSFRRATDKRSRVRGFA